MIKYNKADIIKPFYILVHKLYQPGKYISQFICQKGNETYNTKNDLSDKDQTGNRNGYHVGEVE